jgi:TM2 domain-containing membrane protein YozV
MRKGFIITLMMVICVCLASELFAQQLMQEVVYLKNGSIIRGVIIEQVPNVSIKIQTTDGNVFVYDIQDILKITKEYNPAFDRQYSGGEKSPAVAFLLSFIVPGVGQYYNGDIIKGVVQELMVIGGYVMAFTVGIDEKWYEDYWWDPYTGENYYINPWYDTVLTEWFWVGLGLATAGHIWSIVDAPLSAINKNKRQNHVYGHTNQFGYEKQTIGLNLHPARNGIAAGISLHF